MTQLASQWLWTGEKLSDDQKKTAEKPPHDRIKTSDVYILTDKTNIEVSAAIKVYKNAFNQRASRCAQSERIILQKLEGKHRIEILSLTTLFI